VLETVAVFDAVHPALSVTVNEYVEAPTPLMFDVVPPLLHEYVKAAVPFVNDDVTRPLDCPQLAGDANSDTLNGSDVPTLPDATAVQPAPSVTVTVYVPAANAVIDDPVEPLLQLYV
jgi:hypothetical protein